MPSGLRILGERSGGEEGVSPVALKKVKRLHASRSTHHMHQRTKTTWTDLPFRESFPSKQPFSIQLTGTRAGNRIHIALDTKTRVLPIRHPQQQACLLEMLVTFRVAMMTGGAARASRHARPMVASAVRWCRPQPVAVIPSIR